MVRRVVEDDVGELELSVKEGVSYSLKNSSSSIVDDNSTVSGSREAKLAGIVTATKLKDWEELEKPVVLVVEVALCNSNDRKKYLASVVDVEVDEDAVVVDRVDVEVDKNAVVVDRVDVEVDEDAVVVGRVDVDVGEVAAVVDRVDVEIDEVAAVVDVEVDGAVVVVDVADVEVDEARASL